MPPFRPKKVSQAWDDFGSTWRRLGCTGTTRYPLRHDAQAADVLALEEDLEWINCIACAIQFTDENRHTAPHPRCS